MKIRTVKKMGVIIGVRSVWDRLLRNHKSRFFLGRHIVRTTTRRHGFFFSTLRLLGGLALEMTNDDRYLRLSGIGSCSFFVNFIKEMTGFFYCLAWL